MLITSAGSANISADFKPSPDQIAALDSIGAWLKSRSKPFYTLHGYAGSGKSTIAGHIVQQHDGPVYGLCYTGKAASVLTKKGIPSRTLHSAIYLPMSERKEEATQLEAELASLSADDTAKRRKLLKRLEELNQPTFTLRLRSPFDPKGLLVLDECSMVNEALARDLLSFGLPALVLGDPGQLEPIEGAGYFDRSPDFTLSTIHRQALESPVLRLALMAREGRPLPYGAHGSSRVIRRRAITPADALNVEQILTGSNKARIQLNAEVRQLRGFSASPWPLAGERVICLRNNARDGLLNGMIFTLRADTREGVGPRGGRFLTLPLDNGMDAKVHPECFTSPEVIKSWNWQKRAWANEFSFAWGITLHKGQGSEWESVLAYADMFTWDRPQYAKWLYTACTRASDRIVVAL